MEELGTLSSRLKLSIRTKCLTKVRKRTFLLWITHSKFTHSVQLVQSSFSLCVIGRSGHDEKSCDFPEVPHICGRHIFARETYLA